MKRAVTNEAQRRCAFGPTHLHRDTPTPGSRFWMTHVTPIAWLLAASIGTAEPRPDTTAQASSTAPSRDTLSKASARGTLGRMIVVFAGADGAGSLDTLRAAAGPRALPAGFRRAIAGSGDLGADIGVFADTATHWAVRPRAIEYSDWYYRRLTIHRIGSYAEFPLFAAEYVLGNQLLHDQEELGFPPPGVHGSPLYRVPSGLLTAHTIVAGGLGVLFGLNTITGGWNLWQSRKDPAGRTRRILHSALMLASDFGFAATGEAGGGAKHGLSNADLHRSLAEGSMGVAAAGTIMMWVWNR